MIDIVLDRDFPTFALPAQQRMREVVWQTLRLAGFEQPERAQLCLRLCDDEQIRALNRQWRQLDQATDVLSFPWQHGPDYDLNEYLGDLALAVPFIQREAARLTLPPADHLCHLIVHGTLHLVGFDHAQPAQTRRMRDKERAIMRHLGLHDPFPVWQQEACT